MAGLVIDAFKHLPSLGQAIKVGNWRFEVVDLDGRRVDKVLASRVAEVHRPGQPRRTLNHPLRQRAKSNQLEALCPDWLAFVNHLLLIW